MTALPSYEQLDETARHDAEEEPMTEKPRRPRPATAVAAVPTKRKGRWSNLHDAAAIATFLDGVRMGLPQREAAARAGWSERSVTWWKQIARDAVDRGGKLTGRERECVAFLADLRKATADCKAGHLAVITRAAQRDGQWQASAWLLERRFPDEFGRRVVEVTGADGGPIQVEERLVSLLDQVRQAKESS